MPTVEVVMDMVDGQNMVTIVLVLLIGVAVNLHLTNNQTMLIDISHMLHGELVVMALDKTTEVLEDVKASL